MFVGTSFSYAEVPSSFRSAKKAAAKIYDGAEVTFYCGCKYNDKSIVPGSCGYKARKNATRGKRLEWEHVVSAYELGRNRKCWKKNKKLGTRANCNKEDSRFVTMTSDLHNLVPAVGELNADRSNFRFAPLSGEVRNYGQCDFEVDFKQRVTEPPVSVRGDIARIYYYMSTEYGLKISQKQLNIFQVWNKIDPVDNWERERNRRIFLKQGKENRYVEILQ